MKHKCSKILFLAPDNYYLFRMSKEFRSLGVFTATDAQTDDVTFGEITH